MSINVNQEDFDDQQNLLEALHGCRTRLAQTLGPTVAKNSDVAHQACNDISDAATLDEREDLITAHWSASHLDKVRPILHQMSLLERQLSPQEEVPPEDEIAQDE